MKLQHIRPHWTKISFYICTYISFYIYVCFENTFENINSLQYAKKMYHVICYAAIHLYKLFFVFVVFFQEMLATSKREFHEMFKKTYGVIYEQNAYVFTDFFEELEKYYTRGQVDLAEAMDHFFSVLYQRMFTVINSQYHFDDK